jgi:hypothetical protein
LCRPSTSFSAHRSLGTAKEVVDGRDKRDHDDGGGAHVPAKREVRKSGRVPWFLALLRYAQPDSRGLVPTMTIECEPCPGEPGAAWKPLGDNFSRTTAPTLTGQQ